MWQRLREQVADLGRRTAYQINHNPLGILIGILVGIGLIWIYRQTRLARNLGLPKSLWEWLDLLIIPLVLALVVWIFDRRERYFDRMAAKERVDHEQSITDQRTAVDRQISRNRANQQTMETCLEYISDQLLNAHRSRVPAPIRTAIVRARVLEVLDSLADDHSRRNHVLRFLYETDLLNDPKKSFDPLFFDADLDKVKLPESKLHNIVLRQSRLSSADLSSADLRGSDLTLVVLEEASLRNAILDEKTRIDQAILDKADFTSARLSGASLTETKCRGTKFNGADFQGANLTLSDLSEADLDGANLSGAVLDWAQLGKARISPDTKLDRKWHIVHSILAEDVIGRGLQNEDLTKCSLRKAQLTKAVLDDSNLSESDLSEGKLTSASLRNANLTLTKLKQADLSYADLYAADLSGADLTTDELNYVNLRSARLSETTTIPQKWRDVWTILNPVEVDSLLASEGASTSPDDPAQPELLEMETGRSRNYAGVDLSCADLSDADMQAFDLRNSNFTQSLLKNVNLTGANLEGSNLEGCNLTGANLEGSNLEGCNLTGAVISRAQLGIARNVPPDAYDVIIEPSQ